jgi:hypothetical protein
MIAAVLTLAAIAVAQAPQPATITGTIVAMRPSENAPKEIDLRLESSGAKDLQTRIGQTLVMGVQGVTANWRAIGLGDQVRVQAERGANDALAATGKVERLGRGEFVNPGRNPSRDLGSPNAKVLVKFLAPLQSECHRQTADLLQGIAAQNPDKVRVQIFDVMEPAAREEMGRERLTCATVLVNNRYQFTLDQNGRKRAVELIHRPNTPESTYNSEDALAVVQLVIERLYPGAAPGGADSKGTYTPPKSA